MGAQRIWLAGTEALRQAANSHEFQRHLAAKGLEIQILTGQQEAALSFAGIKSALSLTGQLLAFDLGAGSLELMAGKDGELRQTASLPLGAGRLTERFFISDPPRGEELQTLEAYLEAALALQAFPAGDFLVGVGGTVTVLCQLARGQKEYSPDLAGAKLTFAQLERSYRQLSGLSSAERTALPGLANPRRAKLSLAGVAVIYKLLEFYRAPELVASQAGVLEGMMERLVRGD